MVNDGRELTGETLDEAVGEVVEASLEQFVAEAPAHCLYEAPEFGSLVRADDPDGAVFAAVAAVETGSLEPNRRAVAFWQTEAELRRNQPQIFELLSTRFTAVVLAHRRGGRFQLRLPPRPPRVHGFVYACTPEEIREVTADPLILRSLLNSPSPTAEELVAAVIRTGASVRENRREHMVTAGKYLALLLGDDYVRLRSIIRRIE